MVPVLGVAATLLKDSAGYIYPFLYLLIYLLIFISSALAPHKNFISNPFQYTVQHFTHSITQQFSPYHLDNTQTLDVAYFHHTYMTIVLQSMFMSLMHVRVETLLFFLIPLVLLRPHMFHNSPVHILQYMLVDIVTIR